MQSEEQRQQVKTMTMQALSRLEALKLEESSAPPISHVGTRRRPQTKLLGELDSLPPPPKDMPKGGGQIGKSSLLPRGM